MASWLVILPNTFLYDYNNLNSVVLWADPSQSTHIYIIVSLTTKYIFCETTNRMALIKVIALLTNHFQNSTFQPIMFPEVDEINQNCS